MKGFYAKINKSNYYFSVLAVIAVMFMGLFVSNPKLDELTFGYIIHLVLVMALSVSLLLYPKFKTSGFKIVIITLFSLYFYAIFFLYPETWSTFIFICLIPAISIFYFDRTLFYFSLVLNVFLIGISFSYLVLVDQGLLYSYIKQDIIGNFINFIGSQVILTLIFHLSYSRIKQQQVYYEKIQQAERLKTSGQLAAAVAHEIRNPITVVKGFLDLYKNDPKIKLEMGSHFQLMSDELDTAEHVISQFLAIAKPNLDQSTEVVNVRETLKSVSDLLKSYGVLNDNVIELEVDDKCYIQVNKIEFKQLMINLIKNAIEASKNGSAISVTGKRQKDDVEMQIIDNGCGMSEQEVKALGTPFYSLKSKGTGLGLMICFNMVAQYNGTLKFDSVEGEGTTVTIRFPATKSSR
ncbi:sensor histidine kinase [Anaerobacillus alkaliphilus]|uniref:histidine kinase n=1 Tax=Anaerobacillus alkaliphilus TaxID=1548597 RepID=A0A4Q0VRZ8_9BACI|nr:HAMP domain-containing sensor histidine kinase [Anaerobacillus alkaliphilus]RXJ00241.1 sensor histidine kinase [Anaerobacillus alkaliphilus]